LLRVPAIEAPRVIELARDVGGPVVVVAAEEQDLAVTVRGRDEHRVDGNDVAGSDHG
jgi:hypothetical protein